MTDNQHDSTAVLRGEQDNPSTALMPHRMETSDLAPKLTFFDAFALLVSLQIGSGIFSSPSQVNKHTPAPGFALLTWLISGLLAWMGSMSFAELGAAVPVNGGMQEYLKYIYGDVLASLASWIWIMAVKPSSMAILSIVFAQYWINSIFAGSIPANGWQNKLLAICGLAVVVLFNAISLNVTTRLTRLFLWLKLTTISLLLCCALLHLLFGLHLGSPAPSRDWLSREWFNNDNLSWRSGTWHSIGEYTIAIYAGLWAFAGWDNANMIAGEMIDPFRDLPRALNTAQPLVISSFLLANICYYMVLPWSEIDASNTIAVAVGQRVLGPVGSFSFALLVSTACLGSINVNIFTTSRLTVSAAHSGWLPSALGDFGIWVGRSGQDPDNEVEPTPWQTPLKAMLFNSAVTVIYIVLGTFGSLVTFIGIAEYAFFFLTVLGLLVLRFKEPHLSRPYRPYTIFPAIFTIASLFLVLRGSFEAKVQAAILLVLLLTGFAWNKRSSLPVWDFLYAQLRKVGRTRGYESVPLE
jgi:solute carrier family 7 (L-type amino acid transporter), member 9/15